MFELWEINDIIDKIPNYLKQSIEISSISNKEIDGGSNNIDNGSIDYLRGE